MVFFTTLIKKFTEKGEKTGWTYVDIPQYIAQELKPNFKQSFRVKGKIDALEINGLALIPMGEGDFILPLKHSIRKKIGKEKGATLTLFLEEDKDFKWEIPDDLKDCLEELPELMDAFLNQPKSHQHYFIKYINDAKTEPTRVKRLTQTVLAMEKKMDYGEMIRSNKKKV
jgi:hypothetical protein